MKYSYLEMSEIDFRYIQTSSALQQRHEKDYGIKECLSAVEVHTLNYIVESPGITLTQLSAQTFRTKSTLSPVVNRLIKIGLIEKIQNNEDKRVFSLFVKPKGEKVIQMHRKYNEALYKEVAAVITAKFGKDCLDAYFDIEKAFLKIIEHSLQSDKLINGESLKDTLL